MKYFLMVCLLLLSSSCQDTFETDISHQQVSIITPANGVQVTAGTRTFLWKEIEGVDYYRFILVTPSFTGAAEIIADTQISGWEFKTQLASGEYQWSLTPYNFAYAGLPITYTLHVVDTEAKLSQFEFTE